MSSKILKTGINTTLFAAGTDDLRPAMSGVFFQFSTAGLNFVATDAHKLVKYSRTDVTAEKQIEFVVPRKPLNVLTSILGNSDQVVKMEYTASNAIFTMTDYVLSCRLIEEKYPNYQAVIPTENPNKMTIDRTKLLNGVKCVSIFANRTTHQIQFKLNGNELNLIAEDIDFSNKANERLDCSYIGEEIRMGFNSRFLTQMLTNIDCESVMVEMSTPNRAGILTPCDGLDDGENLLMLVMPVKLSDN